MATALRRGELATSADRARLGAVSTAYQQIGRLSTRIDADRMEAMGVGHQPSVLAISGIASIVR